METFCKQADEKTNITLQHYVDKYGRIYGSYTLWCYLTAIEHPIKSIIYLHQSLVGLQVSAGMCIDCNIAILLFYSAARLELLAQKFRNVKNETELDACITLHVEIL
ncbi:PREDICTED: uncharacterized protein LOC105560404, partial [Vollenhovia emeryi]|uniref:uncharacterized protein LOC105560404 n=1 Tax=Vollenhovia emeryi TaxID=411798 RepID=UPI0005F52AD0